MGKRPPGTDQVKEWQDLQKAQNALSTLAPLNGPSLKWG